MSRRSQYEPLTVNVKTSDSVINLWLGGLFTSGLALISAVVYVVQKNRVSGAGSTKQISLTGFQGALTLDELRQIELIRKYKKYVKFVAKDSTQSHNR